MEHPQQRAGIIAGLTAYVVWGLLTIYWKQLRAFDAFELIGWRIVASAAVMAVVLTVTRRWGRLRVLRGNRALIARVAAASILLTANWTAYVYAVVHGQVLETALGYFIAPIGTVTVGVLVLHEPLRMAQRVSLVFAVASVVVLSIANGRVPWLALLIAGSWTVYGYLKKQVPLSPIESMAAESFLLTPAALALAVALSGRTGSVASSANGLELTYVLLSGLATVTPLMLFAYAAQRVPLTVIGPMQYLVPSMNFLIGWLMYHEPLSAAKVAGFAVLWAGLAVLTADTVRRSRRPSPSLAGATG
ncbi:MAG TPA: EamA family transporter RarD [Acidimicrobiaceae bacterium]|nr:EamA family transporter RarD [Acidimicrobiaceae bacterium]